MNYKKSLSQYSHSYGVLPNSELTNCIVSFFMWCTRRSVRHMDDLSMGQPDRVDIFANVLVASTITSYSYSYCLSASGKRFLGQ